MVLLVQVLVLGVILLALGVQVLVPGTTLSLPSPKLQTKGNFHHFNGQMSNLGHL